MSSLRDEIASIKDLADTLCASTQCSINGALGRHCKELRDTLESVLDTHELCIDDVFVQVSGVIGKITKTVAADPSSNSFSLSVLMEKYSAFVKDIKAGQIALSNLGQNAKPVENIKVTFKTLAGAEFEKEQLRQALILPFQYPRLYPKRARGILLYGPAGTGKSKLAAALVNELKNAYFFAPDPSSLKGKYEGETEKNIVALYASISKYLNAPAKFVKGKKVPQKQFGIPFIDEGDALLGAGRGEDASKQRTVNTFLQEMDGINSDDRITTLVATNYPQKIDLAVARRLTVKIFVDLPTRSARKQLMYTLLRERYSMPGSKTNFLDLIKQYGAEITERGYISTSNKQQSLTAEQIDELVLMTGPNTVSQKYMTHREGDDEFSNKALREIGFSLSEMTSALELAFNQAASRASSTIATYDKVGSYYVYDPNTPAENVSDQKAAQQIRDDYADSIITFDIRMDDIVEALGRAPKSVDVEEYKAILEWDSGS